MAAMLYDLLKESPSVKIEISLANLIDAIDYSTKVSFAEYERQKQAVAESKTLVSRHDTAKRLNVTPMTLNRWEKIGYLTPQRIGGKVYYKQSDISKVLNEKEANA